MGHLRGRNETADGLGEDLGKQRERWRRSYGRNHPTVWVRDYFQPGHTRVKEQATPHSGDAKGWKAALAHRRAVPIFLWTHPVSCRQRHGFVREWLFFAVFAGKSSERMIALRHCQRRFPRTRFLWLGGLWPDWNGHIL